MSAHLTESEAEAMLNELKYALIDLLNLPGKGDSVSFDVKANDSANIYTIGIFRGSVNSRKMNYNARIKLNNTTLLELHINAGNRHMNPDGELVTGNHWHIYREGYGHSYAFPVPDISDHDFVDVTIRFLERFHVVERPKILEQIEF